MADIDERDPRVEAAVLPRLLREKAELAEDEIAAKVYLRMAKMIERALKPKVKNV